ncbi:TRAP transporter large permease [Halomonas sp. McH1-25]|uniref:TRAP transporter large permease n=1 Tax=unclassified Halomonas TaxID=2609666 RepID=UPI001EF742CD|nr:MULTISPECIES: TRAP transporter large permease [unclassified Halomonas]MCG7601978.1 TRAP transporter large permease [Halomonas sp. McH1-25]MCP1341581.1 TRAP transporter large permease [Halomonas sp. FL8]MCP1360227.1 TRAP transporter large permease [Halomonas sp. BBD45]
MDDTGLVLIFGLFGLLIIGTPIAIALGLLTLIGVWMADLNPLIAAQRFMAGSSTTSLLAIPGFILAGELMGAGGLSRRLVRVASTFIGHLPGGLSMSTVGAGTFFGAISGSAPATTAAIGSVMIDELETRGYKRGYAAALATAVGPLGQMIPPSIPMVIWGVLSEESISKLFLAGVIPGLLAAAGFCLISVFYAKRQGIVSEQRATGAEILSALRDGLWALLAPVVILGGIYGGIFTPTEAAMVGAFYSAIIGLFIYRDLQWRQLPGLLINAMRTTAVIMFIIVTAYGFAFVIASEQLPTKITEVILGLTTNPLLLLLFINLLLLVLGAVMDNISAMVIMSGVLIGIGAQIGLDPIQLGAMVVINFAVGMVTPPLGYSIFVASSVSGMSIERIAKHLLPFLGVLLLVVGLIAYVPAVTLWLPDMLG